jgi:hypothetical protein
MSENSAKNMGAWSKGIDSIRKIAPIPAPPARKQVKTKQPVQESSSSSSENEDDTWDQL